MKVIRWESRGQSMIDKNKDNKIGTYIRKTPTVWQCATGLEPDESDAFKSRVYILLMTMKSRIMILKTLRTLTPHYQDYISPSKQDVLRLTFMRRIPSFCVNPWRPVTKNITGTEGVTINFIWQLYCKINNRWKTHTLDRNLHTSRQRGLFLHRLTTQATKSSQVLVQTKSRRFTAVNILRTCLTFPIYTGHFTLNIFCTCQTMIQIPS